jgi:hypothetical protein
MINGPPREERIGGVDRIKNPDGTVTIIFWSGPALSKDHEQIPPSQPLSDTY